MAESPPTGDEERKYIFKKKPDRCGRQDKRIEETKKKPAAKDKTLDREKKERVYIFRKRTSSCQLMRMFISKESLRSRCRKCSKPNRTHPKYIYAEISSEPQVIC